MGTLRTGQFCDLSFKMECYSAGERPLHWIRNKGIFFSFFINEVWGTGQTKSGNGGKCHIRKPIIRVWAHPTV
jgi:hypothetical protein